MAAWLLSLLLLAFAAGCSIDDGHDGTDSADMVGSRLSLLSHSPDALLPVVLETMLRQQASDLPPAVHFVTQGEGVAVWAARGPEGRVCLLYEHISELGAFTGSTGGTCELTEQEIVSSGGAVIFAGAGRHLLAIGLAIDGYDEVRTTHGGRYPVTNNGFVVRLLPSIDFTDRDALQFENLALVGPHDMRSFDSLARPGAAQ